MLPYSGQDPFGNPVIAGVGAPVMVGGTPMMGAGTPMMGVGTPMMGVGTPMMGVGTPMMGVGTPMMGGGMMGPGMMNHPGMMPGLDMNMSVPLTEAAPSSAFTAQGGYVHSVPMQDGMCASRYFDPLYSAALGMTFQEFDTVIAELNSAMDAAVPPRFLRMLPVIGLPFGFLLFAAGGFYNVATMGSLLGFVMIGLGFASFVCSMFGMFACACFSEKAVSAGRMKLSEFNARYAARHIEFHLHEQMHLQMHSNYHNNSGPGMSVHTVTKYTLVIQVLDTQGRRSVPTPDALAQQMAQQAMATAPPPPETEMGNSNAA